MCKDLSAWRSSLWQPGCNGAACFLQVWAQTPRAQTGPNDGREYFVTIQGGRFALGCETFYPVGWNHLWLEWMAAPPSDKPPLVRQLMDEAVADGFTVLRAWATAVDPQYSLQPSPGNFSEPIFRGLDYVLDQARQRNLKMILSLIDNWNATGSVDQIVQWSGSASVSAATHEEFFTDAQCQSLYKQLANAIVTRTNSINGRRYADDPTVMSWNLINEPRCYQCGDVIQNWADMMATYIKSIDSNHLVTVGEEGFYAGTDTSRKNNDPEGANSWAFNEGQDFPADHSSTSLDYASIHLWPDAWLDESSSFPTTWLNAHMTDAAALGKPLLLEEFGKTVNLSMGLTLAARDQLYSTVYSMIEQSIQGNGTLLGSAFWQWYAPGQGSSLYSLTTGDSTYQLAQQHAATLKRQATPANMA
eukprot:jgi/Astpho2/1627/e_gw1.00030.19.1_t